MRATPVRAKEPFDPHDESGARDESGACVGLGTKGSSNRLWTCDSGLTDYASEQLAWDGKRGAVRDSQSLPLRHALRRHRQTLRQPQARLHLALPKIALAKIEFASPQGVGMYVHAASGKMCAGPREATRREERAPGEAQCTWSPPV